MFTASLLAVALLAAQPVTKTTPVEVLEACRFNAALVDDTLMHHWADLTGTVTDIQRDGIGGYIVKIEGKTHTSEFIGRVEIHCHFPSHTSYYSGSQNGFAGNLRPDLAQIKRNKSVTIRGVFRNFIDHLHFPVDRNVVLVMKDCELVPGAE